VSPAYRVIAAWRRVSLRRPNEMQRVCFGSSQDLVELLKREPGVRNFIHSCTNLRAISTEWNALSSRAVKMARSRKGLMPRPRQEHISVDSARQNQLNDTIRILLLNSTTSRGRKQEAGSRTQNAERRTQIFSQKARSSAYLNFRAVLCPLALSSFLDISP
jgi:hypothetical protein